MFAFLCCFSRSMPLVCCCCSAVVWPVRSLLRCSGLALARIVALQRTNTLPQRTAARVDAKLSYSDSRIGHYPPDKCRIFSRYIRRSFGSSGRIGARPIGRAPSCGYLFKFTVPSISPSIRATEAGFNSAIARFLPLNGDTKLPVAFAKRPVPPTNTP